MHRKRKKSRGFIALFMTLLMVFQVLLPATAFAKPVDAGNGSCFGIEFLPGGVKITSYKDEFKNDQSYTSLAIPSTIFGNKVVEIGKGAFANAYFLQEITIPDTVTKIGENAFSRCASLKEITIPGSVVSIEMLAFTECSSLERVYILYGVQSIGDGAFAACVNLKQVSISPSTESMPNKIFDGAEEVKVQANPDSVAGQFTGLNNDVKTTELPADSPSAYKYVVDEATGEIIVEGYVGTSKQPVIPSQINGSEVTGIGEGAFQDKPITQVTLPPSLKSIGANAFAGTNLVVVEVPSSVTEIGSGAFDDKSNITLKGDSPAVDEFIKQSQFIQFTVWGPGRSKYHEMIVKQKPDSGGVIVQGRSMDYREGTVIPIEAVPKTPANTGSSQQGAYRFNGWTVASKDGNVTSERGDELESLIEAANWSKTTIKMPSYDIILTANYELIPPEPLVIENGIVVLYTGEKEKTELVIPSTYNQEPVTGIGNAYRYKGIVFVDPLMEKVTIPPSIVSIYPKSFMEAEGLKEIFVATNSTTFASEDGVLFNHNKTKLLAYPKNKPGESYKIPDSVTEIGAYAFYQNIHLKTIDLNKVTKIGDNAFQNAMLLNNITIPNTVSSLGEYAFQGCTKLSSVVWEENSQIKTVPAYAFGSCAFTEVELPDGAIGISDFAYMYCRNLTTVHVSKTITNLASNAFYGCNNISAIHVEQGNPRYASEEGVLFNQSKSILMTYPIAKTEENGSYVVPDSVHEIASGAFGHAKFTNIDISNAKIIGTNAFGNANIESIDLTGVTRIDAAAFTGCPRLKEVEWPIGVTKVADSVFYGCPALERVVLPNTVQSIENSAFYSCRGLKEATLPESLTRVGAYAFYGCSALESDALPQGLVSIDTYAFYGCRSMKEISVPASVTNFGAYAFAYCSGLEKVVVAASSVPAYGFVGGASITSLDISGVTNINPSAFQSCSKLPSVTIGANIGKNAFASCIALGEVTLLDSVEVIDDGAFLACNALKEVSIPKNVKTIGLRAFNNCESLASITVAEENTAFSDDDGILHDKEKVTLICYPQAKAGDTYTTLTSVKAIGNFAFESTNNLLEVKFGETVNSVGLSVFYAAPKLNKLYVYNQGAEFARGASYPAQSIFYGIADSNLQKFIVYGYLNSTVEKEVFSHRSKGIKFMTLDSVTPGLVIQKIEKNPRQRTVTNQPLDSQTWLGKIVGYQVPLDKINSEEAKNLVVPSLITEENAKDLIIQDVNGETITLGEGENIIVSVVGSHAFWYPGTKPTPDTAEEKFVKAITTIQLPQTITEIETSGFEECTALHTFKIPISVQKIRPYAFKNCTALTEIEIPENIAMLGADQLFDETSENEVYTSTFFGCSNLKQITVAPNNKRYASIDGVLTNRLKNKIYEVPNGYTGNAGSGIYNVPKGILSIGASAFVGCTMNKITFTDPIQKIGIGAFRGVLTTKDSTVTFSEKRPENLKNGLDIGNEAFKDCTGLTTVKFPPDILRIGDDAFIGCTALTTFDVPNTSEEYRSVDGVLMGYDIDERKIETYAVYMYPYGRKDTSYTVPTKIPVRQIYKSAFQGNNYLETVTLSKDVRIIDESAFRNCIKLSNVEWGSVVQKIGGMAFSNTALKNVSLPLYLDTIGQEAFSGTKLESADINCAYTEFGPDVFKGSAEGFVLRGLKDSTAQTYATDNNFLFEELTETTVETYTVTVDESIQHGTLAVSKPSAVSQELITVTVTPEDGYKMVEGSLKFNDTAINEALGAFEMPPSDVVVTAQFELIPENTDAIVPDAQNSQPVQDSNTQEPAEEAQTPSQSEPESTQEAPDGEF